MNTDDIEYIKEMEENSNWLEAHFNEIKEKYLNKFIVIKDKAVIIQNKNLEKILEFLQSKKEDVNRLLIEFIHGDEYNFIL